MFDQVDLFLDWTRIFLQFWQYGCVGGEMIFYALRMLSKVSLTLSTNTDLPESMSCSVEDLSTCYVTTSFACCSFGYFCT